MTTVLVVEDDQDIRDLLVDSLCDMGYEVIEGEDGPSGLQCALENRPDIILLDVMMPVMDGFEVLERLKTNPATQAVPVIMVSAKGQEQDVTEALKSGALNYLIKPWEPGELEAKILQAEAEVRKAA